MLSVLFLFSLLQPTLSQFMRYCEPIKTKFDCLDNTYCAWCNTTSIVNDTLIVTESCIFKNTCSSSFNDTNCIIDKNDNFTCDFIEVTLNIVIFLVLIACSYTIIYSIKNIINVNINNRYIVAINLLLFTVIFLPPVLLLYLQSSYFIPYLLILIILSVCLCCCGTTSKYRQQRYQRIN